MRYRIHSTEYVAKKLLQANIPVIQPTGGHAVYLDAKTFCPHIPANLFPGQALACALYKHAGVRTVELGSVMFGRNNDAMGTNVAKNMVSQMELVRLAIPRRVYTQSHMDYVIESLIEVYKEKDKLKGLKIIYEPPMLRHFSAKFVEV